MIQAADLGQENQALRERLSSLSEASLRINESLELDAVLQGVLDSARSLTHAPYGVITLVDDAGEFESYLSSGLTPEESQRFWEIPGGPAFSAYLSNLPGALRVRDFSSLTRAAGFPEFRTPAEVSSFLAAPIRHRGEAAGNIYLAKKEPGQEFTPEDEEILIMFASQAALVIANARSYRDEQRARSDLEALVNTAPVGVVVFNAGTGGLDLVNSEARRIVSGLHEPEQSAEELLELLTIRRADGSEIPLEELFVAQAFSRGETVRAEEISLGIPDGSSVSVLMDATPIRSREDVLESIVVTLQDMTPIEELERLRTEFLGIVSHELQTPLTSIKGSTAALMDESTDLDPAVMRQFHRIIDEQADHMRDLMSGLLDAARIEAGTLSVAPEPVDVARLVDDARIRFVSSGARNNLQIDLDQDVPLVMADRRRIVQVIGNLLSNAARYSPELSLIRVAAVRDGARVALSVSDDGAGLPAERLPHLFRKFSRLDGENRGRDLDGSGLGLAICKGLVEAHSGRIWAESDGPGLGSRFTFTIPAVEEPAVGIAPAPRRGQQADRERTRVLAVDDDPQTLRYVRDVLAKAGYAPTMTGDPQEVARLIEEEQPHLVLLDLMLPGTDGIELMQQILDIADVPVIFLSVYGQDETIARAFDAGATDYVVKPFSPTELAARIRAALRKHVVPEPIELTQPYSLGDLNIDYARRRVTLAGRPIDLTPTEYGALAELTANAGRVMTHGQLLQRVWGARRGSDSGPVRNIVARLRRKLGDDADSPTYIFSERYVGYRFAKPPE